MDDQPKVQVKLPEAEANELTKRLRHTKALSGVGLSVYAMVTRSGIRALHLAADCKVDGKMKSYDVKYKADTDMAKIERNAVKRLSAEFEL
jgi:hypothetical protein